MACAIRLSSTTLEPFHLGFPKFVTSYLYPLDTLSQNVRRIDVPGRLLQSFFKQGVMKNLGNENFHFCLKWLKFVGGGGTILG